MRLRWLTRPDLWLLVGLGLFALGGTPLLNNRYCRTLDERDWSAYGKMNQWQAAFDTLSAVCGVGLLTNDFETQYSALGRWALTGFGVGGALLYLAMMLLAIARLRAACDETAPLPPIWLVLPLFLMLLAVSGPLVWLLEYLATGAEGWAQQQGIQGAAWRAIAAVASLGWLPGRPPAGLHWIYALFALLGGLGWMFWLLPVPPIRRHFVHLGGLAVWALGYICFLVLMGLLIATLESPRPSLGPPAQHPHRDLSERSPGDRFLHSAYQATAAATAGMPTAVAGPRSVTEGTQVVLGLLMLVGPLGGAAGGGMTYTLLGWAFFGLLAAWFARKRPLHTTTQRCLLAGGACLVLLLALSLVTTLGLLVIEQQTASPAQSPPRFADAFLDASAAVGGGRISAGVFADVTHRKLSSGIRQPVDEYQYGMAWLMAAMLLGRVVPVFVLCQAARIRLSVSPSGWSSPQGGQPPAEAGRRGAP